MPNPDAYEEAKERQRIEQTLDLVLASYFREAEESIGREKVAKITQQVLKDLDYKARVLA